MNAEIAKILGENLDSNGTMVLFENMTVIVPAGKSLGELDVAVFDDFETASDCKNELNKYLDECAKSHTILFRPKIHITDFNKTFNAPTLYAGDGYTIDRFALAPDYTTIIVAQGFIDSGIAVIDENKYAVRLNITLKFLS